MLTHSATAAAAVIARRLFLDRHLELWLRDLDPAWSLAGIRARVVAVIDEAPGVKSFVLRPNRRWRGQLAGQHTTLEVEIAGVRTRRCYSLSSAPGDALPTITVKRLAGGLVSGWLHDHLRPGDVVGLSPAAGDFVLPDPLPARILMLSGGSGVTPILSMIRDLDARGALADVACVHYAASRRDVVGGRLLDDVARRNPGFRLILRVKDELPADLRFSAEEIRRLVPDFARRDTFLCGPPRLMESVERLWADQGLAGRLRRERFTAPAVPAAGGGAIEARVNLGRSARSVVVRGTATLLEELERAGERPASGCRMGICQTCRCRKTSGAVRNLRTGEISTAADEEIQLCISVARSDLTLDL